MSLPLLGAGGATDLSHLTAYSQVVKALNPSLHWALDDKSRGLDLSGNARDGTATGGVVIGANADSPITGESASTDFDGSNDYVLSAYNPFLNGTTRTFCGWANRDASANADMLFSPNAAAANRTFLRLASGGTSVLFSTDNNVTGVTWASAWPGNGEWVHWGLIYFEASDEVSLYINGALVSTEAYTTAYNAAPGNFAAGFGSTTNVFDGKMVHVAVFETDLAANMASLADASP